MKKRKETKSEIVEKILTKYEISLDELNYDALKQFKEKVKALSDTRQKGKVKYKIWDIVVVSFLAILGNCNDWEEIREFAIAKKDWLKNFLMLTGGIPSAITYKRIFSIIKSEELENICVLFAQDVLKLFSSKRDIMNIDGKVDNGSKRNENDIRDKVKSLNALNVYSNNLGLCVASEKIEDKTNEIPTIPKILERINVKGNIITWDALNTQTENVKAVIDGKGDYVVPIKGNQGNFYNDLIEYFDEKKQEEIIAGNTKSSYLKYNEKSHSSIIVYEYFQTSDVDWYFDKDKWAGLKSIGMVKKTITKNDVTTVEYRYYISSLNINIIDFSNAIRNHWSVENKLHFHLDFTFREDANTTKNKDALMNLQIINKFTLGILNKVKPYYNNISLKKIRKTITFNFEKNFITMLCYLALC